jgi:stigma-specific protein Stig1
MQSMKPRGWWAALAAIGVLATVRLVAIGCGGDTSQNNPSCPGPNQTSCNGNCTDLTYDRNNCGACGTVCDVLSVCSKGACASECSDAQAACTPEAGGMPYCADTQSDSLNCGGCGMSCGPAESCVLGQCIATCAKGQTACAPMMGMPYCANVAADNANCGGCGHICGAQQVCSGGMCQSECIMGQSLCGTGDSGNDEGGGPYCANLQTDNANCGMCNNTCGIEQVCVAGKCASECLMTQTLCIPDGGMGDGGPFCANTATDSANCGACFNQCPYMTPICAMGKCLAGG